MTDSVLKPVLSRTLLPTIDRLEHLIMTLTPGILEMSANYNLIDADSRYFKYFKSGTSGIEYSVDNSTWF